MPVRLIVVGWKWWRKWRCKSKGWEKRILPVFGTDVRHDVLVKELEDEWDTVGKHQVLGDNLKLQGKKEEAAVRNSLGRAMAENATYIWWYVLEERKVYQSIIVKNNARHFRLFFGGCGEKQPNITAECGKDQEPSGVISHAEATWFISMPSLCASQTIRNRFDLPL